MPPNKKKRSRSGKTKAEKREAKGLPPFAHPKALCLPPAKPKGCITPTYTHSKALGGYLVYTVAPTR